jgi:hypothetical protein
MSVYAAGGATRDELLRVGEMAMRLWPIEALGARRLAKPSAGAASRKGSRSRQARIHADGRGGAGTRPAADGGVNDLKPSTSTKLWSGISLTSCACARVAGLYA